MKFNFQNNNNNLNQFTMMNYNQNFMKNNQNNQNMNMGMNKVNKNSFNPNFNMQNPNFNNNQRNNFLQNSMNMQFLNSMYQPNNNMNNQFNNMNNQHNNNMNNQFNNMNNQPNYNMNNQFNNMNNQPYNNMNNQFNNMNNQSNINMNKNINNSQNSQQFKKQLLANSLYLKDPYKIQLSIAKGLNNNKEFNHYVSGGRQPPEFMKKSSADNFNGQNLDNKINVVFLVTQGNKHSRLFNRKDTIRDMLVKFIKNVGLQEYHLKNIYFLFNAVNLNTINQNQTLDKIGLRNNSVVTVLDLKDIIGA